MMKKATRFLAMFVALVVVLVSSNASAFAASLHIYLVADSVSIIAGSSKKIIVNTDDKYYKATIADTKIATISVKGTEITVKGVKAGTTKLTVWVNGKSESCKVTITKNTTKLSLSKSSVSVYTGKSTTLKVTTNAKSFKASVADKKIATISTKGSTITVKGVKVGSTTVKVTANGKTASCKVTVKKDGTTLKLSQTSVSMIEKNTAKITVTTNAKSYTVKVSDGKTIKVTKSGNKLSIKGLKPGTAKVTVKAGNKTITCKVTVKKQPIKTVPDFSITIKTGESFSVGTNASSLSAKPADSSVIAVRMDMFGNLLLYGLKPGETNVTINFGGHSELWHVKVTK